MNLRCLLGMALALSSQVLTAASDKHEILADAKAGEKAAVVCGSCHGVKGESSNALFPSIAGQNEKYIIKQLKDFQSSKRQDPVMNAQVANLSEEDIVNIAAFYAQQDMPMGEADPSVVALGEAIYRGGNLTKQITACGACHGPSGAGNLPAGFPQLSGQQVAYTVKQLEAFRRGDRANDANGMMRSIAARMSDAEIKAVAEYIRGLRP